MVPVNEKVADPFSQPFTSVQFEAKTAPDPLTLMMPLLKVPMGKFEPCASLKEVAFGSVSHNTAEGVPLKFKASLTRGTVPLMLKPTPTVKSV